MPKMLPTSVLLRNGEVSDAFVREKLECRAAYNTIRTICGMTDAAAGGGLMNRCKLPPELDAVMRLKLECRLVGGLAGLEVHDFPAREAGDSFVFFLDTAVRCLAHY